MGWTEDPAGLTKIRVPLPNHSLVGGESIWARHIAEDRYELRNVPFHAYDLNFLDVVEAVADADDADGKPTVRRVTRRSGHRTLRVCFDESSLLEERLPLLMLLRPQGATFEGASERYFAIDVEPHGNYAGICAQLQEWQQQGLLWFETCGARAPGSFDEPPSADRARD
jgi:hypothetical protein